MIELIFKALGAGLSIWESKEKHKYRDKYIALKTEWYHEFDKGEGNRSNDVLDRIERELRILVEAFSAAVGTPNA